MSSLSSVTSSSVIAQFAVPKISGYIFTWILYGFFCSQAWTYYQAFPKDPSRIKILVSYLLLIGTIQTAMNIHDTLITFGTHFGDTNMLQQINLGWFSVPVLTVMASCPVQMFYAHRMTLLSNSNYTKSISIVVAILATFASITSIIGGVKVFQGEGGSIYNDSLVYEQMWLVSSTACDVIITITMIVLLKKANPQHKQLRRVVSNLVRVLIESGFATAALSVADLWVFMAFPAQIFHIAICDGLGNMHSVTFLVILTSRYHLIKTTKSKETGDVEELGSLQFAQPDENVTYHSQSSELSAIAFSKITSPE